MALSDMVSCFLQPRNIHRHLSIQFLIFFLFLLPHAKSFSFDFPSFQPNMKSIQFEGDAFPSGNGVLELTKNQLNGPINGSVGHASYNEAVRLRDSTTGKVADFTTHFSFIMDSLNSSDYGEGIAFFIAPFEYQMPNNSGVGSLGLFSAGSNFSTNTSLNKIVAVEFDSFKDSWDPNDNHVGINVNFIVSVANVTWKSSIRNGSRANAWVSYNSTTQNLSVFLTYADNPVFGGNSSLSHKVDLSELPDLVRVGFSAATGDYTELHSISSWSFNSSLEVGNQVNKNNKVGLGVGLGVGFGVLSCGLGLLWFIYWRKRGDGENEGLDDDVFMDDEFEKGTGPRRFTYRELTHATNNFAEGGKLGEGGFGGVYKGFLSESSTEIAVKRVSKGSKQGRKEYMSEVNIISRLRHRNLVQLIGWCHAQGEFLLVYEYMPNGSLDTHLFGGKIMLTWPVRDKIALGLASSLLYLHEEWEQCVVHRDIKSSNIMLDAKFNAKLGDFGLARLVDHELGSQTTVLAGTMGYLAPECVTTGRASKESDVYSFGVVCLEIACGRKPVDPREEPSKVRLVEWVWNLYGKGQILEAVDKGLSMEFDEQQMERLMVVGLWCCHPDPIIRPSIKQVINVLNSEVPLPELPSKFPVPMYSLPPVNMSCLFSDTSLGHTGSTKNRTECSCKSCSTYLSNTSAGSATALLNSGVDHAYNHV
ncbi:L-type lectin-domain containing receptor kinase IX.1-like [Juglans microcarpa x Juglans regia]|uniref:L-type lectin-domain containing receptor kinase IX.1-like n=1 Tax=Juglans microcarpa x Juglans regia TaxID=2249226 RepID=UPI001B7DFE31|nr:L-type lectin-domain containing receptor kinase IX.1-like [Juglans microcarpa x Juglans regia]